MTPQEYAELDAEFARAIGLEVSGMTGHRIVTLPNGGHDFEEIPFCQVGGEPFQPHLSWSLVMPEAVKRRIGYNAYDKRAVSYWVVSFEEQYANHPDEDTAARVAIMRAVIARKQP